MDAFTVARCIPDPQADALAIKAASPITEAFSCAIQAEKRRCEEGGGRCETIRDGYYTVNVLCVLFGLATFVWYIKPKVMYLQSLPLRAWRLSPAKDGAK